jgi:hypothetical protein
MPAALADVYRALIGPMPAPCESVVRALSVPAPPEI